MGWFDGTSVVGEDRGGGSSERHHHRHSSGSKKRSSSSRGIFGLGGGDDDRHSSSHHNASRSSFFSFGGGRSSSSYYKRSPRKGYMNKMMHQLRRLWRDLMYYAKKNPVKVFMLVIMPLLTSGALVGLLSKFGVRLPGGLDRMLRNMGGGGMGRGGGSLHVERERYEGPLGGVGNVMGAMGGASGIMNVAKMFI